MSQYMERAKYYRTDPEGRHNNCAQAVLLAFAPVLGVEEDTLYEMASNFASGMKTGGTCGAITGALMALGLAKVTDAAEVQNLFRAVRDHHEGLTDCGDLLRENAVKGGDREAHCDGMVFELVELTEEIMKDHGVIG